MAYSRSEYPPPLPRRAPRPLTTTEPHTTRSTGRISSRATGRPWTAAPLMLAALGPRAPSRMGSSSRKGSAGAKPRHADVHELALAQRHPAHGKLGRVGIDLDHARALPLGKGLQLEGRALGAREVRDSPLRAREARGAVDLHGAPHALPHLLLADVFSHARDPLRALTLAQAGAPAQSRYRLRCCPKKRSTCRKASVAASF